ncbi:hypothetical protein B0H11DRAFT_2073402 [Mycena galericulata]|nr:hypothetical protein B0H11DRAFT_2073402 [Mycena galericulata]
MSILLATPTQANSQDTSVQAFTHAPPYIPGPYATSSTPQQSLQYVPSLPWFCLTKLARFPDQVNAIGASRLTYNPPTSEEEYDILRALIPSLPYDTLREFDWAAVDPRLWATIVQIYDGLPPVFHCYPIPLADEHMRLLQNVESTPQFSLLTILELPGCRELSDMTIVNLKHLHSLCAFDASATSVSSYALKVFSGTVLWADDRTRRGPWGLRILRLRNCLNINDSIVPHLSAFPLLSILDLRGTKCRSETFCPTFQPAPPTEHHLYNPTPLRLSVTLLSSENHLFSSPNLFKLYINTLYHPAPAERPIRDTRPTEDVCVTFSAGSSHFVVGTNKDLPESVARKRVGRFAREIKTELEDLPDHRRLSMRFPDAPLHNHIAEQELSSHTRKQNILSFYHSGVATAPRKLTRGYSYPAETALPSSSNDAQLMLYRPPPPWAALEAITPDVQLSKPARTPEVVTGLSKRKQAAMADYADQLAEKRRKIHEHSAVRPTVSAPETADLSRNPFRRKVTKQDVLREASTSVLKIQEHNSSVVAPLLPLGSHPKATRWRAEAGHHQIRKKVV